ncbi:MAG: proteasome activator [Acidimicrobiales bacterium]
MDGSTDVAITPRPDPWIGRTGRREAGEGSSTGDDAPLGDPAEFVRIATMLSRLNGELEHIDLDEQGVDRLQRLHDNARDEVRNTVGDDLAAEMERLLPKLGDGDRTEGEVRVAHLQLAGWLQGVAQGIQLAAVEHQMRQQLAGGSGEQPAVGPARGRPVPDSTGTYL